MVATMVPVLGYPNINTSNLMLYFTDGETFQILSQEQPTELEANTGASERQQLPACRDNFAGDLSIQQPLQQQAASDAAANTSGRKILLLRCRPRL